MNFELGRHSRRHELGTPSTMATLERALRQGCRLHAFMSGDGTRVVRLEKRDGLLAGYGEGRRVSEAAMMAAENFKSGKTRDLVHTEARHPDGELDAWIRRGHTFDAWSLGHTDYAFQLRGLEFEKIAPSVVKRWTAGDRFSWTSPRGVTWIGGPVKFGNGDQGCTYNIVAKPHGMSRQQAEMYYAQRTGYSIRLEFAIERALQAELVEEKQS